MYPMFYDPAGAELAREYSAAVETLRERTGKEFHRHCDGPYRRRDHVGESDVLRHHPDLCSALRVRPCAADCNRAATHYFNHAWWCDRCQMCD